MIKLCVSRECWVFDGTNKTQVLSGNFDPRAVFPTPGGDKLIILTSFIEGAAPNLYAISLR